MKNIFDKGHRRSIRMKGYDYSEMGYYFVTICVQNRENLLGEMRNNEVCLNEVGKMIEKWWWRLEERFSNVRVDEFVVMPNHFHGILEMHDCKNDMSVGAPLVGAFLFGNS